MTRYKKSRCKYCEIPEDVDICGTEYYANLFLRRNDPKLSRNAYLIWDEGYYFLAINDGEEYTPINYCPKCGRRLKDEESE